MNFFGIGPAEFIVILVVALVFVGPERLPRLAAELARTIREIRKYTGGLAAEFKEVVADFEKETEGERSQWKEIGEGITGATQSVTEALRSARADAEKDPAAAAKAGAPAANPPQPVAPIPDPPLADTTNGTHPAAAPAAVWKDIAEPPPPEVQTNGTAPTPAPQAAGETP